ncbi:MAG: biopolymer transporter ExbD [Planctomycetota bacterium]
MPLKIERDDQTSINLTPMIDIVFLLIIFFMVGTRFSELDEAEREIKIQVPTVSEAAALTSKPRRRVIDVFEDGRISLDANDISIASLEQELTSARDQYEQLGVVIRGDAEAKYQRVAEVIRTCGKAKISVLNIAVQGVKIR